MTGDSAPPDPGAVRDAVRRLRPRLAGDLDVSTRRLAEYSSDASNYRLVPAAVVFPRSTDDVLAVLEEAGRTGVPVTARGGGTSIAGNAVGSGFVLDLSRHLTRILDIDPTARTAVVEPGVLLGDLQRTAAGSHLRFGPDPSSQARCTIGGMIGNNACGPRAVAFGRTADNTLELDVVDGTGRRFTAAAGLDPVPGLADLVGDSLAIIRTEFGTFGRQVSGYSLEHLLPERGASLARALVGSEGTCGVVLRATVRLVPVPPATALTVLGYPDMPAAADDVPALLGLRPVAVESLDSRMVDVVRSARGAAAVPDLPAGRGWLFVESRGDTAAEALAAARAVVAAAGTSAVRVVADPAEARVLWRIREDGVGLAGRTADGAPAWPGWEDAAVPPDRLGAYLRDFEELKRAHGVDGLAYGHFGDGCVHTRLDFPLADAPARFAAFLADASRLVVGYGGSLSGEHGDGRARSEFLPLMYSPAALAAFGRFKRLFDPADLLNPGVLVGPDAAADHLRMPGARPLRATGFALRSDGGDLSRAVHRCVGVGKCRADNSAAGGMMCPSFLATRDERDSTRGRARVLQEMVNGTLVRDGWSASEVAESLDLCLSCRACGSECPAGVDMATYKSEVLYRRYRRRPRPASHYALGQLPRWLAVAQYAPGLLNRLARVAPLRRAALALAGIDQRRAVPALSRPSLRRRPAPTPVGDGPEVVLWADSFTNALSAAIGTAAAELLTAAGYRVLTPDRTVCCGLTWITTGQLDGARHRLRRAVDTLRPHLDTGRLVVGLEPSCTAALRADLPDLLPDDPDARRLADHTRTLAEVLTDATRRGWVPPSLAGLSVLVQPHCHHSAVLGFAADRALLTGAGADVTTIAGCCGLAGNFGMERGHYDVSVAVAENGLLPALRSVGPETVLLADGFSCRTQAEHLAGRTALHLAELFAARLRG